MSDQQPKIYAHCPFDKSHIIESCKLLKHIAKCKSQNKKDFEPCPFNPLHWIIFSQIDQHKLKCRDRNKQPLPQEQSRPKKSRDIIGGSLISEIPVNNVLDESEEIYQLGLDFQRNKPPKNQIQKNIRKKIDKKEMKELNKERLWQEPNFTEWFHSNYDQQQPRSRHGQTNNRENRFLIEDDF